MPNDKNDFDDDTEPAMKLPKVKPEVTADDDPDEKKAGGDVDDMEIDVDPEEVRKESERESGGRKY